MPPDPAAPGPGRDEDPARRAPGPDDFPEIGSASWRLLPGEPDWMDEELREAYLASLEREDEPGDPDLDEDPDASPPPGLDDARLAALLAGAREVARAGFAADGLLDGAAGCAALMGFAAEAAGDDDRYAGSSADELLGAIRAWDRVEAHAAARKHSAVAELIRRNPEPGCAPKDEAQVPEIWDEFTSDELASALAESRFGADRLLELALQLEARLPGTKAAFRSGMLRRYKVEIIARATEALSPAEAQAAEALVLDRASALTPGGLRSAIARAVMEVAPDKARKRREKAAKDARVERWAEDSGNAALAGRELPPAEVLAADQKITWWAQQLRKAGLDGDMDQLRARAYLDILLGVDSRPERPETDATGSKKADPAGTTPVGPSDAEPGHRMDADGKPGHRMDADGGDDDGRAPEDGRPSPAGPGGAAAPAPGGSPAGVIPPGFAGRVMLTIPLSTLLELAERPGEVSGIGPIDPALARDLAAAAARNPRSTWCVTVTDADGHAIGHGCARPEPASQRNDRAKRGKPGVSGGPGGHDPPPGRHANTGRASRTTTSRTTTSRTTTSGAAGNRDGPPAASQVPGSGEPRFAFIGADHPGPPGGYGTWRLATGGGHPDLIVAIGPLDTGQCDHRHQAVGHDPGVMLRHLAQVRHATCTGPACRRPSAQCDFEHNIAYETGGRTCLCNANPKCRRDHRMKQDRRWTADQLPGGYVRWTTPAGRQYTTEPTRYPI